MGTITQNTDLLQTWNIDTSDDTYILARNASIESGEDVAIFQNGSMSGDTIILKGDVSVDLSLKAIELAGDDTSLLIRRSSTVNTAGNVGVYANGSSFELVNDGEIKAKLTGVYVTTGAEISNTGTIRADFALVSPDGNILVHNSGRLIGETAGIRTEATDSFVQNEKGGRISGGDFGIEFIDGGNANIRNFGTISGATAISDLDGEIKILNRGVIDGNVQLGGGNDIFENRGSGVLKGKVDGGDGADVYIVDDHKTKIDEQADHGMDEVRSKVSYTLGNNLENLTLTGKADVSATGNSASNSIYGNAGDNILKGLDGDDYLGSGAGNDVMIGGTGGDLFEFNLGTDKDVIKDFENGTDVIFSTYVTSEAEFDDLVANHLTQKGDDLLIKYGSDSVLIENMSKADLDVSDFFMGL